VAPRAGAQESEAEFRELLARAHGLAETRADAARRLSEYGVEAVPALGRAASSGNDDESRLALIALSFLAEDPAARAAMARTLRSRESPDLRLLAAIGLSFPTMPDSEGALLEALTDSRSGSTLRTACALALGGTGYGSAREACLSLLEKESDPLVAGAIGIGFGLAGQEAAIPTLEARLSRAREAPERAGLLLALGALDRRQVPAVGDLALTDPVLPYAAALHYADEPGEEGSAAAWKKALAEPSLAASLYAALGRGAERRSLMRLTEGVRQEVDPRVRAALYGAAATRRETPLLLALRADPEDRANLFSAAALFLLAGGSAPATFDSTLVPAALEALAERSSPGVAAAAVFLAAARFRGAEEPLGRWAAAGGPGAVEADLARKALAGELEERAFRALVRRQAFDRGILLERAVADGIHRFATVAIGGASEYFARRREHGPAVPRAWLGTGRPAARDAPLYEDLWILLSRRPFDAPLRRGR
jgi:hypothetical protein